MVEQQKCTRTMLDVLMDALVGADRVVVQTKNALGEMDSHYLHAPEILDALQAAPSPVAVVKPLGWGRSGAKTPFGNYIVTCEDHDSDTVWFVMFGGRVVSSLGAHSTEAEAKAAAQADYERRILSAITIRSEAEIRADERAKVIADAQKVSESAWKSWSALGVECHVVCDVTACEDIADRLNAIHSDASRKIADGGAG
jgi:hypothetical protein